MLNHLVEEKGLVYSAEEQRRSRWKGNKHIKAVDDFWNSYSWNNVGEKFKHVIWEVRDEEKNIIQRFEYVSKKQKANYGGEYTVEFGTKL